MLVRDAQYRQRYEQLQRELQQLQNSSRGPSQREEMAKKMFMGATQSLIQLPNSRRNEIEADVVCYSMLLQVLPTGPRGVYKLMCAMRQ